MRLLHISDIHIGVESYGRPATQADVEALPAHFARGETRGRYAGANTRLLDFLTAMDFAVDYALTQEVDLVLFSGDAYKLRDPSQTHQREFARRIARLANAGVPVFLTVGNHDLPHIPWRASALDIFPTLQVENVTVAARLGTHRVRTRAGELQVVALPWIRTGQYLAREDMRGLTLDQIRQGIEDGIAETLEEEVAALDPDAPAVFCGHITVSGATFASEQSMMLGDDHVLGLGLLARREFDYVALGHMHRHQTLTQHPPVVYAGSIERVDFGEENDDKGFVVVDLDPAKPQGERVARWEFVSANPRPMTTIDVRARSGEDPTEAALSAVGRRQADAEFARAIVRLRIEMTAEQEASFREREIRQALEGAHLVAGVERRVQRERRTRLGADDAERLAPLDVLRRYFESKSTPAAREAELIGYAERLLAQESES